MKLKLQLVYVITVSMIWRTDNIFFDKIQIIDMSFRW